MHNVDFVWKGVSAASLGLCVTELPPVQMPSTRDQPYIVPYRDGQLHIQDGTHDEIVKRVGGYLPYEQGVPVEELRRIIRWLQGRGRVSFSDDPGREYDAYIVSGIDYNQWVQGFDDRVFEVYFACQPMAYFTGIDDIVLTASGTDVYNPGFKPARPLLRVTGEGDVTITIGDDDVTLLGMTGTVYIDCDDQEAYSLDENDARVNQNGIMSGDFPIIEPGVTSITWSGSVTKIVMTPRWRD